MSIIAFPVQASSKECQPALSQTLPAAASRRRGTLAQGRALETLGHAVEYLVDSRLFHSGDHNQEDEQEAVQILMRMSRAVFAECLEVISLNRRFRRWVADRFLSRSGRWQRG